MAAITYNEKLIHYLEKYVSDNKQRKIDAALEERTRATTVVVEDIFKPHNASAVLRTCDCFGLQDVHVIENRYSYNINPYVTRGASKWVDIHRYNQENANNTEACYQALRKEGYKIYATSPGKHSQNIRDIVPDSKIALILGSEHDGLSEYALENADERIHIPMVGFTESYNISVTAAICLYEILGKMKLTAFPWQLSSEEKNNLRLDWYRKIVKNADIHEKAFNKTLI